MEIECTYIPPRRKTLIKDTDGQASGFQFFILISALYVEDYIVDIIVGCLKRGDWHI